jgi:SRSO17 transposase
MSASSSAPGAQQQRFAAYLDSLARAAGNLDRAAPLESYCTGLQLAESLAASSWENASWREGTKRRLRSRFAAQRVRIAHRDYWRSELPAEEWLLIEWPTGENEPTKYWLSTLPVDSKLVDLVRLARHRWVIERDYEELKQELGLGRYEGRSWRGFHHHGTLCIAAYGFLVAERSRFFPLCSSRSTGPTHPKNSARLPAPRLVAFAPRGIIRTRSLHSGSSSPDFCSNSFVAVHFVAFIVYDTVVLRR